MHPGTKNTYHLFPFPTPTTASFIADAFQVALSFWFTRWLSFALVFESRAGTDTLAITLIID